MLSAVLAISIVAPAGATAGASDSAPRAVDVRMATELRIAANGERTVERHVFDPELDRYVPIGSTLFHDASITVRSAVPSKLPSLAVLQSSAWAQKKIKFDWTPDLKRFRKAMRQILKLVTQRRGDRRVPKMVGPKKRRVPADLEDFDDDPILTRDQGNGDGINWLAGTEDNRFFFGFISTPPSPLDPIIRSIRFESGQCVQQGARFFCDFHIDEGDVYFRFPEEEGVTGFWQDLSRFLQRLLMTSSLKFIHGHKAIAAAHSISQGTTYEVDQDNFEDEDSRVWQLVKEIDRELYDADVEAPGRGGRRAKPLLVPGRDDVIVLNELEPPEEDDPDRSDRQEAFLLDQILMTNLRGFSNKRDLEVEIFRGRKKRKKFEITSLSGASLEREIEGVISNGNPVDAVKAYRLSHLHLGQQKNYQDLVDAVMEHDRTPDEVEEINGVFYDHVIEVTICVTGHMEDKNKKDTVQQRYLLAYNDIPE